MKRIVALLLALIMLLAVFTGCQSENVPDSTQKTPAQSADSDTNKTGEEAPTITLTWFDKNTGEAFTDPVAEVIKEKTGINIEIQQPTGDPNEKLILMMTGDTLPDVVLMDRRSDVVNQYIEAGALIPLDDLIEEYGSNIKEMYGDVINLSRYSDGHTYFLNNWYGVDPTPDRAINMRMDILEEFGYGEKAKNGEYFTQDEFVSLLKAYKEKYPEIDGQETIPFTVNGEYMETVYSTFRGMYGMKNYYETDDQQLLFSVRDPRYLEMVTFINSLYHDGLLDREWAVTKTDAFDEKVASGKVFAANGGIPSSANSLFKQDEGEDTNKQFYSFKVVADGVDPDETTFSPRSSLGWDAIGITRANKYPEETIRLFDFLASEEGQYLLLWGVEGEDWTIEDGVHVPAEDTIPGFREDWSAYSKESGIRKWTWFIKNGYGSDGTPYDLVTKYDLDEISTHALKSMEGSIWDTAPYDNVSPTSGTPEALAEQKCNDIIDQYFSKMVYADSEAEITSLYDAMMVELEANDAATVEKIYTENYRVHLELWS